MKTHDIHFVLIAGLLTACVSAACGQYSSTPPASNAPAPPPHSASTEHAFRGTVQRVDLAARTLSVAGEDVPGWMSAMTMTYKVKNAGILDTIKVGDSITAKVYDGDFQTLYDVQIAPKGEGKPPSP